MKCYYKLKLMECDHQRVRVTLIRKEFESWNNVQVTNGALNVSYKWCSQSSDNTRKNLKSSEFISLSFFPACALGQKPKFLVFPCPCFSKAKGGEICWYLLAGQYLNIQLLLTETALDQRSTFDENMIDSGTHRLIVY
jgi:hypothetical protein